MISGGLTIQRLLSSMKRLDASDLHIKVGLPPVYRIGGRLKRIDSPALTEEECDHLFDPVLTPLQKARLEEMGNLDFAWHLPDGDRFRIDLFRSGNHIHAAVRRVKAEIPSYADLHLPPIYGKIVSTSPDGLVLICGVTGCGKSSTIAAMIEQINLTEDLNIITVEDPIEYRFTPKKAVISQREVGIDVDSFKTALRYAVRQDPDVIFIGEMRDAETVLAGIQAAETGHLVFATLHTSDTMQSLARMLEFFPPSERDFIRSSLANTLRAVCAQKLIPAVESFEVKVVPACEVLLSSPAVRDKIREGEDSDLPAIIAGSRADGMQNFTIALANLVEKEWVDLQTARGFAPNRDALDSILKGVEVKSATLVSRIKAAGSHT
ncbi:MAG TPA: PilT/PilU family type 4a pilus ATPase [Phycisphaerales bacterium]|nr:PilT/PilU family type 4a pilus ATPase [Phycisphaerales bacterium]